MSEPSPAASAESRERLLTADPYPRCSEAEMSARRRLVEEVGADAGVDAVLVRGADKRSPTIFWLTGWPVTNEALVVVAPGERMSMAVSSYNHAPFASEMAGDCDVTGTHRDAIGTLLGTLASRRRVGVIGLLPHAHHHALSGEGVEVVGLNAEFRRRRVVKSAEEIEWLRVGAHLSDLGVLALRDASRPGTTGFELANAVERAYVGLGGDTHIHFIGVTSMDAPDRYVPAQWPTNRVVESGSLVMAEISAQFWCHPGQVLRTIAVDRDPPSRIRALHDVADAAFERIERVLRPGCTREEIQDAASVIEDAGYTICDGLVHGFGGGFFDPSFTIRSLDDDGPAPPPLEPGTVLVVQPNVIEPGGPAGVQTGEMLLITQDGCERMHTVSRGFWRT